MALHLPMSLIQERDGASLFSPLSFPLFWALEHDVSHLEMYCIYVHLVCPA